MGARIEPNIVPCASRLSARSSWWVVLATVVLASCSHARSPSGAGPPGAGGTDASSRPAASGSPPVEDRGAGGTKATAPAPGPTDAAREMAAARVARNEGRLRDAALGFERVIRADPTAFEARLDLAEVLLLQSIDLGRVATLLDEARALRSHDVQVDRLRAWLDELNGDPSAAADDYGRVLADRPDLELRLRRASLLMRANRIDDAIVEYEKVVLEDPSDRGARTTLAGIYEYQGRWADAERMLVELERLAPGELAPLQRLAAFYRRTAQLAKATETEARVRALVSPPRSLRPLRPSVR